MMDMVQLQMYCSLEHAGDFGMNYDSSSDTADYSVHVAQSNIIWCELALICSPIMSIEHLEAPT